MTSISPRAMVQACLLMLLFQSVQATAGVAIYVAYAENERTPVYFPDPWMGSPKTTFLGYPGPSWDTGAVLLHNTGTTNVVLWQLVSIVGQPDRDRGRDHRSGAAGDSGADRRARHHEPEPAL